MKKPTGFSAWDLDLCHLRPEVVGFSVWVWESVIWGLGFGA